MKRRNLSFCTMLSALALVAVAQAEDKHEAPAINEAVVVLVPMKGYEAAGVLLMKQDKGFVHVTGEVKGLKPGLHGFHIHQFGDLRAPDGLSAGGHYNPHNKPHGKLDAHERHEGDLGNIEAGANGVAKVDVKAPGLELHHVIGRGVVVHANPDDFSQPVGNAGPRAGVGVIGLAEVKAPAK